MKLFSSFSGGDDNKNNRDNNDNYSDNIPQEEENSQPVEDNENNVGDTEYNSEIQDDESLGDTENFSSQEPLFDVSGDNTSRDEEVDPSQESIDFESDDRFLDSNDDDDVSLRDVLDADLSEAETETGEDAAERPQESDTSLYGEPVWEEANFTSPDEHRVDYDHVAHASRDDDDPVFATDDQFVEYDPTRRSHGLDIDDSEPEEDSGLSPWAWLAIGLVALLTVGACLAGAAWYLGAFDDKKSEEPISAQDPVVENPEDATGDTGSFNTPQAPGMFGGNDDDEATSENRARGGNTGESSSDSRAVKSAENKARSLEKRVSELEKKPKGTTTATKTKTEVSTTKVPGPEKTITKTTPGPQRTVPGPERTVNQTQTVTATETATETVPGPRVTMTTTVIERIR